MIGFYPDKLDESESDSDHDDLKVQFILKVINVNDQLNLLGFYSPPLAAG